MPWQPIAAGSQPAMRRCHEVCLAHGLAPALLRIHRKMPVGPGLVVSARTVKRSEASGLVEVGLSRI